MRRPLSFVCFLYAVVTAIVLLFLTPEKNRYTAFNKEEVCISGTVKAKEYRRASDGTLTLLVTLRKAAFIGDAGEGSSGSELSLPPDPDSDVAVRIPVEPEEGSSTALEDLEAPIGSRITVSGTLRCYKEATNEGEFDSLSYYRTSELGDFSVNRAVILSSDERENPLLNRLYLLKRHFAGILDSALSEESASVMKAMLLGEKGYLDQTTKDLYQAGGIIHILAISGTHISLLGMGLYQLLRERLKVRRWLCCAASSCMIVLYCLMTGLSVSAFRAVFMFLLHMAAVLCHRTYDVLTAVSVAGVLLLVSDPYWLLQSGFQFSFAAVLSLSLLLPVFTPAKRRTSVFDRVGQALSVTVGTLPVYLTAYGYWPVISLVLNPIVLPLMSVLMVSGLAILLLGSLSLPLGQLTGHITEAVLVFYRALCTLAERLPRHLLIPGAPSSWQVVLFLVCLSLLVLQGLLAPSQQTARKAVLRDDTAFPPGRDSGIHSWLHSRMHLRILSGKSRPWLPSFLRLLWLCLCVLILLVRDPSGLSLTAADVGQGDGILLQADGAAVVIDGGSTSRQDLARYQLRPLLYARGAGEIDLWVITHDDADHCSGLLEILEEGGTDGIRIRRIVLADIREDVKGENYLLIEERAAALGIPVTYIHEGMDIRSGKLSLYCLHPEAQAGYEEPNAYSVTLLLSYGNFSALLTGDLDGDGETRLLSWLDDHRVQVLAHGGHYEESGKLHVTLLKVAHHGSKGATSDRFLSSVSADLAVISCGVDNRYGHPHAQTLERLQNAGIRIYDTRYTGEITFHTDGQRLSITAFGGELEEQLPGY